MDIRAAVLSADMNRALWGNTQKDALHFFSGSRVCKICKCGINTPYGFPEDKVPKHEPCTPRVDQVLRDGMMVTLDLNLPTLDPVGSNEVEKTLTKLHRDVIAIEEAQPLLKTLLDEMIPV